MKAMIEICCGSYQDALAAWKGGAKRIELNSALALGGLTPSLTSLILTKQNTDLKVITMIRPRGAGFCYSEEDYEIMKQDAQIMLEHGADGLAFGFLNAQGFIDIKRTQEFVKLIHSYHKEAVFHRAFDCVADPIKAIEQLIDLGVDRLLTSGLKAKAVDALDLLERLQREYGQDIEILAGSGVNASNVLEILEKTGLNQVHSSCKDWVSDPTTIQKDISFAYAESPHQEDYEIVSQKLVERLLAEIQK